MDKAFTLLERHAYWTMHLHFKDGGKWKQLMANIYQRVEVLVTACSESLQAESLLEKYYFLFSLREK